MSNDLDRMKTEVDEEGIVIFIDKMTEKKKKNRYRHVKDGCPKKERGREMPGLSFNPHCGACGGLNSRGFCNYTACKYPMTNTTALPVMVKEKKPYAQPLMEIFDIPDDVEEILIRTKEKTMRYVSDGDGWMFQEVSV